MPVLHQQPQTSNVGLAHVHHTVLIELRPDQLLGSSGAPGENRPLVLFGHSRGAAPATCLAYRLQKRVCGGLGGGRRVRWAEVWGFTCHKHFVNPIQLTCGSLIGARQLIWPETAAPPQKTCTYLTHHTVKKAKTERGSNNMKPLFAQKLPGLPPHPGCVSMSPKLG